MLDVLTYLSADEALLLQYCLLFLVGLLCTAGLTQWLIRFLGQRLVDVPNARSNHTKPVPRGGGLAIIITILLITLCNYLLGDSLLLFTDNILLALLALAMLSLYDDAMGLSPLLRLGLQFAIVFGLIASTDFAVLPALPYVQDAQPLLIGITLFAFVWFINLYNFMDGIDGITGIETVSILAGIMLISTVRPELHGLLPGIAPIIGCSVGFLRYNWHKARIFLGDVGSISLGFLVGWYLLLLSSLPEGLIPALILPMYYLADTGVTLIRRALNKEKIWQAHSSHYYQQAVRAGLGHDTVVLRIAGLNLCLAGLAFGSVVIPEWWLRMLMLCNAVLITAIFLIVLPRKKPKQKGSV